jgi:hypothetical protein
VITTTYALSGLLLASAGWLFAIGALSATGQTVAWTVIFFFASAAASSAYLTVSGWSVFAGYLLGSLLMLAAALVALRWAFAAECKPLEAVAKPLASIE